MSRRDHFSQPMITPDTTVWLKTISTTLSITLLSSVSGEGRVHTNSLENFWSLFEKKLRGTYVSVDPRHLFRYLDESCFRFNKRHLTDPERLSIITTQVVNRRLTYEQLTSST